MEFTSDKFLKTSVCAYYSQTIKKNKKKKQYLYSQNTQETFFGGLFLSFVAFGIFCVFKKGLFYLQQEKVLRYAQLKMYYIEKSYC